MTRLYRKVIKIKAEDSPNVQIAIAQKDAGIEPTGEVVVPGVIGWYEYCKRRATWDAVRQCIGLDGEFYEGASVLLFPPTWLNLAEQVAARLSAKRKGVAMGVDTAEGGDSTCWAITDYKGLIHLRSEKTPDTSVITGTTLALAQEYGIVDEMIMFDQGGGGLEHADRLRAQGHKRIRTVFFGEPVAPDPSLYIKPWDTKQEERRERYTYKNRRAHIYHLLRLTIEPIKNAQGEPVASFGLPAEYSELRRQLAPIPLSYDEEGRIYLPPKRKRDANDTRVTLTELIGCSPDEADALTIAVYAMQDEPPKASVSGGWF